MSDLSKENMITIAGETALRGRCIFSEHKKFIYAISFLKGLFGLADNDSDAGSDLSAIPVANSTILIKGKCVLQSISYNLCQRL